MMLIFGSLLALFGLGTLAYQFRRSAGHHREKRVLPKQNAQEILRDRYAKGEISRDEFYSMREDLDR